MESRRVWYNVRSTGDSRNERKSVRSGMKQKQRKPKDLAEKLDKSLRVRHAEVVKLRELVKKAESKVRGDGKSSDRRR
jgi:hypothetical protein